MIALFVDIIFCKECNAFSIAELGEWDKCSSSYLIKYQHLLSWWWEVLGWLKLSFCRRFHDVVLASQDDGVCGILVSNNLVHLGHLLFQSCLCHQTLKSQKMIVCFWVCLCVCVCVSECVCVCVCVWRGGGPTSVKECFSINLLTLSEAPNCHFNQ